MVKLYDDPEKLAAMRAEAERNIRARTLEGYRKAADIEAASEVLRDAFSEFTPGKDVSRRVVAAIIDAAFQEKP